MFFYCPLDFFGGVKKFFLTLNINTDFLEFLQQTLDFSIFVSNALGNKKKLFWKFSEFFFFKIILVFPFQLQYENLIQNRPRVQFEWVNSPRDQSEKKNSAQPKKKYKIIFYQSFPEFSIYFCHMILKRINFMIK